VLPSNALEVALFGEADRMHEVALTEDVLRNEVDVVKEEIKVNVHNRPYGGFPWLHLPAVMYETFPNAHDGYGSFEDLEAATLDDTATFFDRYYAPANAVLALAGDVDTADVQRLVERHFSRVPKRAAPPAPNHGEPVPTRERRAKHTDPNAPLPALALGYRVPDPLTAFDTYVAAVVLSALMGDGPASRLYQRLVKQDRLATHVSSYVATFSEWLATRDPTMLEITAYYPDPSQTKAIIAAIDEECAKAAADVSVDELDRVRASLASDFLRENDQLIWRTLNLAVCEQQRGRAELTNEVPAVLQAVTPDDIAKAASTWLDPDQRAVLEWRPGAKP
jgi:predicted Zn-dependent peptidase